MDCRDLDRLIDAYLDGELPAATAGELSRHLSGCARCQERYGPLVSLLAGREEIPAPVALRDRIMTALREEAAIESLPPGRKPLDHPRRSRWWLGPVAVAASVALFAFGWLSSQLWNGSPAAPPPRATLDVGKPSQITVVVSPWVLSSYVQGAAVRVPAGPMLLLAHAVAAEAMTAALMEGSPVQRCGPSIDADTLFPDDSPLPNTLFPMPLATPLGV